VTMVVEVFPEERRGRALGLLLTFGPLGAVAVAVMLAAGLQATSLGWRLFYLVGLVPLVVVAVARRRLPETPAFEAEQQRSTEATRAARVPLLEPWLPAYRRRLVLVGLVSLLQSLPSAAAVAWWAYYAERQQGASTGEVATYVIFAYGAGLFGYYSCGRLMDRFGRRPTAIVYVVGTVAAGVALFQSGRGLASAALLALAVFFGLGIGPVLSAFATELFPTRIRAQASSWVRNWFAIVGSALGPALVGVLGDPYRGVLGNIGNTLTFLMPIALPAAFLIWRFMPETRDVAVTGPEAPVRPARQGPAEPGSPELGRPAPGPSGDARQLRKPFALGLALVIGLLAVISGAVLVLGTGAPRPAGAAQDWLFDVSGTTARSGRQSAEAEAAQLGSPALARPLIVPGTHDQDAFTRVVVGEGTVASGTARVPFTVVRPMRIGAPAALAGTLTLRRTSSGWRVERLSGLRPVVTVPPPASPALPGPVVAWGAGTIVVILALSGAAGSAVRRAGPA
jgi:MFS family permease